MAVTPSDLKLADVGREFEFYWFSELLRRPVCAGKVNKRLGKLSDLVFQLTEPHPEAAGIYIEHGWGKPTEFIPWDRVTSIESDAIFVLPPERGDVYPPFVDQPGWILIEQHLMGKTILDTDGRRVEVVNDVHLLYSRGRMIIVHVDASFNGFLRRWGLGSVRWIKDRLISWRYVQPFSVEDAVTTDTVSLSVKKGRALELPGEDLADVLEMLSGKEQQAFFAALDTEKAAETLSYAEPRAKRQLIATLRKEKAQNILSELSVPQLADLFSVLPYEDSLKFIELLPEEEAKRIRRIISEREITARELMSGEFLTFRKDATVAEVLATIRTGGYEHAVVSYLYVVEDLVLIGVVDLRDLVLAPDAARLVDLMITSVVAAEEETPRDDLEEMFAKYHFRMIPVLDVQDRLLGVIYYNDIMQGLVTRAKP
ncbi:MAG: CBS domain-containing protein [Syntrophorhabdales bacterium]|jgi:CBS domain-containing protein/sporulation protein YlmC with PRC-barrel domain